MTELIKPGTFSCIVCVDPVLSPRFTIYPAFNLDSILKRRDIWPDRYNLNRFFSLKKFVYKYSNQKKNKIKYG